MKNFELVKESQRELKEEIKFLKEVRGVNYTYWVNKLEINKGTMSGWIGSWRNLPKEVEENLKKEIEKYKKEVIK